MKNQNDPTHAVIGIKDYDMIQRILGSALKIGGATTDASTSGIPIPPPAPKFVLGSRSLERLSHVHPQLAKCVKLAITLTTCDFTVLQGLRTYAEQVAAVKAGNSRTMHSMHLPQADGLAHAVDLGAWLNGQVDWTPRFYADIAFAMDLAATDLKIAEHIRWGGAWDRRLSDFGGNSNAYIEETQAYAKRHAGSDLIDMPHFEWVA